MGSTFYGPLDCHKIAVFPWNSPGLFMAVQTSWVFMDSTFYGSPGVFMDSTFYGSPVVFMGSTFFIMAESLDCHSRGLHLDSTGFLWQSMKTPWTAIKSGPSWILLFMAAPDGLHGFQFLWQSSHKKWSSWIPVFMAAQGSSSMVPLFMAVQ